MTLTISILGILQVIGIILCGLFVFAGTLSIIKHIVGFIKGGCFMLNRGFVDRKDLAVVLFWDIVFLSLFMVALLKLLGINSISIGL
jgi:hypothetical protein